MEGSGKEGGGAKGTRSAHPALQKEKSKAVEWHHDRLTVVWAEQWHNEHTLYTHLHRTYFFVNANSPSAVPDATEDEPVLDGTESKHVV